MTNLVPLVLAGGSGTRLWPLSRELFPKQFHALFGGETLLQGALGRSRLVSPQAPLLVCNEEHRFLVAEQCRAAGVEPGAILLEPQGRNTAPAIALAAHSALANNPDALLLVLPSDHVVRDEHAFQMAVVEAAKAAEVGRLVTFGLYPSHAETGYGYIEVADRSTGVQPVSSFVEKPSAEKAEAFLASGRYLWNSGMFVLHARTYRKSWRACARILPPL
ncbi:MAG: mannose-1-phosphate guanylyltransferase [Pseudomonadales bacterium]